MEATAGGSPTVVEAMLLANEGRVDMSLPVRGKAHRRLPSALV